jgi:hypothetical protein
MISDGSFHYAQEMLRGIASWVEENEHITPRQVNAVERVRLGGTRDA